MILKLDLIQNSYDYLNDSLECYHIASEYGEHKESHSRIEKKRKWKLAYITMVQSIELLFKECLSRIKSNLIYENIDEPITDKSKSVSIIQAVNRLNNFSGNEISDEDRKIISKCAKRRNEFIHYAVHIQSEQIKKEYLEMFSLYNTIHEDFIGEKIPYYNSANGSVAQELKFQYDNRFTVFRGSEMSRSDVERLKEEIEENSHYSYYLTYDGRCFSRIKYGEANKCIDSLGRQISPICDDYEYCLDCLAKQGEYHLDLCDLERCPVCGEQLLTCGCIECMSVDKTVSP